MAAFKPFLVAGVRIGGEGSGTSAQTFTACLSFVIENSTPFISRYTVWSIGVSSKMLRACGSVRAVSTMYRRVKRRVERGGERERERERERGQERQERQERQEGQERQQQARQSRNRRVCRSSHPPGPPQGQGLSPLCRTRSPGPYWVQLRQGQEPARGRLQEQAHRSQSLQSRRSHLQW